MCNMFSRACGVAHRILRQGAAATGPGVASHMPLLPAARAPQLLRPRRARASHTGTRANVQTAQRASTPILRGLQHDKPALAAHPDAKGSLVLRPSPNAAVKTFTFFCTATGWTSQSLAASSCESLCRLSSSWLIPLSSSRSWGAPWASSASARRAEPAAPAARASCAICALASCRFGLRR